MLCFEVGQILYKEYAVIDFKHWHLHCSWGVIRHLCLQRGFLMLTYRICPSIQNFFIDFRK